MLKNTTITQCALRHINTTKMEQAGVLRVVGNELKFKNARRRDSIVDHGACTAVVVVISLLLEKTNGRALARVNDGDARLRHTRSIDLPHTVKLGNIRISFFHNLLRAIEAGTIDDDGLGNVAVVGFCICTHGAVKKRVDVGGMLLALHRFKPTGIELAGIVGVGGNASKRTGTFDRCLRKYINEIRTGAHNLPYADVNFLHVA